MAQKKNRLITTPEICDALMRQRESAIWKIVRMGNVDVEKKYGFLGEEGTLLYVPEPGYLKDKFFVRTDGSAVQLIGKAPYQCAAPAADIKDQQDGWEFKAPRDVPMWATRSWFRIKAISYPVLPSELSDADIYKLGFKRSGDLYSFPGIEIESESLQAAFKYVFNFFHQKWREVYIEGVRTAVLYSFDDTTDFIPEYEGDCVTTIVVPYIELYTLEPVYELS